MNDPTPNYIPDYIPAHDADDRLVDELCRRDEQLRSGTVPPATEGQIPPDAPLECHGTLAFLDTLERAWPRSNRSSDRSRTVISRFRIERTLGRGGFGVVYLATDTRLGRKVALKVPRLHALAEPKLIERFSREAQAAAALDHPNIIPVYEAGEAEGLCYIASAYCPGPTLAAWLKDQRSTGVAPRVAADILCQLSDAVAYSHARGVVHRDIKSANVLLDPRGANGHLPGLSNGSALKSDFTPRLADFGLAKIIETAVGDALNTLSETAGSAVLGTPAYMAPEQLDAGTTNTTPVSDIYSLGVVLYELLTGRVPFSGSNPADVIVRVRDEEPVAVRRLRPDVPRDLETICLKCLEKEPPRRYGSAPDLRSDLQRYLNGEPIRARPPRAWDKTEKWMRRRPALAGLLFFAVASVSCGIAGLWWHNHQLGISLDLVRKQDEKLRSALYRQSIPDASVELADHVGHPEGARTLLEQFIPQSRDEPDVRGREWYWLWSKVAGPPLLQTFAHADGVGLRAAAISPDEQTIVTGDEKGNIRLWSVVSGKEVHSLFPHGGEVKALEFSVDGNYLAAVGQHSGLHIWSTRDWSQRTIDNAHDGTIECVAISRDCERIATGGRDGWVRIWNFGTGTKSGEFQVPSREAPTAVHEVSFSADGSHVIATANEGLFILDAEIVALDRHISTTDGASLKAFDGTESDWFVAAGHGRTTWVGNLRTGKPIELPNDDYSSAVGISADAHLAAVGGRRGNVRLYRSANGVVWHEGMWYAHADRLTGCILSGDGHRLLTCSVDGTTKLWNVSLPLDNVQSWISGLPQSNGLRSACLAPDGSRVAISNADVGTAFSVVNLNTGVDSPLGSAIRPLGSPWYTRDMNFVYAVDHDHGLWRCRKDGASELIEIPGLIQCQLGTDSDTAFVVRRVATENRWEVAGWNLQTRAKVRTIYSSATPLHHLAYRPQDGILLVCSDSQPLLIGHAKSSEAPRQFVRERGTISAAICPTRNMVALVSVNVTLHDLDTGGLLATIPGSSARDTSLHVAFSPDGNRLAVAHAAADGVRSSVEIWDVQNQQSLIRLATPHSLLGRPMWSNDGRRLAVERASSRSDGASGAIVWTFE